MITKLEKTVKEMDLGSTGGGSIWVKQDFKFGQFKFEILWDNILVGMTNQWLDIGIEFKEQVKASL